ncbi:MAG: twin transmembrane helix small protein [Alphaproteobacteria bacterium]
MKIYTIFLYLLALAVLGTLIIGIISMSLGNKFNRKYANKLMTLRVVFQSLAILLLCVVFYLK